MVASSGVPSHDFYRNFECLHSDSCLFGTLKSFVLLAYLLLTLCNTVVVAVGYELGGNKAWISFLFG